MLSAKAVGGGMAALMMQEQKAREGDFWCLEWIAFCNPSWESISTCCAVCDALVVRAGDLKLMDGASRGGIEELRASADAIAKIAKKISSLQLGDKQVHCAVLKRNQNVLLRLYCSMRGIHAMACRKEMRRCRSYYSWVL